MVRDLGIYRIIGKAVIKGEKKIKQVDDEQNENLGRKKKKG